MATQPDRIEPAAPPEMPPAPSPSEAPVIEPGGPGEITEPAPDIDNPDPGIPETPPGQV